MLNLWHVSSGNAKNAGSMNKWEEKSAVTGMARIVERNIDALLKRHRQEEK